MMDTTARTDIADRADHAFQARRRADAAWDLWSAHVEASKALTDAGVKPIPAFVERGAELSRALRAANVLHRDIVGQYLQALQDVMKAAKKAKANGDML